MKFVIVKGCL